MSFRNISSEFLSIAAHSPPRMQTSAIQMPCLHRFCLRQPLFIHHSAPLERSHDCHEQSTVHVLIFHVAYCSTASDVAHDTHRRRRPYFVLQVIVNIISGRSHHVSMELGVGISLEPLEDNRVGSLEMWVDISVKIVQCTAHEVVCQ
jgi:hypothetical protein